ncbi:hypothetical protein AB6813_02110 [bacterium RCC_150]
MLKPSLDESAGHVVHLLERLGKPTSAPQSLQLPRHLGTFGRVMFAFINVLATAGAVFSLRLLWTDETPGWWFNVIFTVMIGGIPVALWAILMGTGEEAKSDRAMQATWDEIRHQARAEHGSVLARDINLAEDGRISSFDLVVMLDAGQTLSGQWRPERASSRLLLQPQVPGIGSDVRVWRVVGANVASGALPLVIQVADPSVVVR